MKRTTILKTLATTACIALALPGIAQEGAAAPAQFRVVVIQGAGVAPGSEKPKHADAITGATSKEINTYTLTDALAAKLKAIGGDVAVVPFYECADLACPKASEDGKRKAADAVVFAGAVHNGPFPKPLTALFPKLKDVVAAKPGLVGSAIACGASGKGSTALEGAAKAFKDAGAISVEGAAFASGNMLKNASKPDEIDTAMTALAERIRAAVAPAK